jgi:IS1 family transposase
VKDVVSSIANQLRLIWAKTQESSVHHQKCGRTSFLMRSKRNTQQLERKHLTLRTRIKRLVHKTICFSKSTEMHDIVIGLFVNRFEFGMEG